MNIPPPTVFCRRTDRLYVCIVRTVSNRAVLRGTNQRHLDRATQYALLLQRDIIRRAESGDLLPPPPRKPYRIRKPKRN